MAPTPSPRPVSGYHTPLKTPQSKQRLHFPNPKNSAHPSPCPLSAVKEAVPTEHPVEVIGRIRDYPDRKEKPPSALGISEDGRSIRVRTDIGYRDFSLDGVSVSEAEDLEAFYKRFVGSRIEGVRLGSKCTIMMYGPTGAGKSHTMFGCPKQPGIVYRALRDILGEGDGESGVDNAGFGLGLFVQVAVLEIYNEEIYDLLSGNSNGGAASIGLPKGSTPKVKLEVMGKKAKNASYISGTEAGKISREVAKVEKRRIVRSTLCNERSSRSHCLIILDVPSVGGRLMLVDMAGSENIDAAGQIGLEAKMQTAKINQGNIALKRVVESIANGDSHVPFRDSKLTMLLQDSFEDDKSKILMILCASPDPKEMHKTISTLEYGAKAKCIVRAAHISTPRDKNSEEAAVPLNARIMAMNQFIFKLQMDNKVKEKECGKAQKELLQKEQELAELRTKLKLIEGKGSALKEEEIKLKVDERTQLLRLELVKMEEKMLKQQEELNLLRQRLEEVECEGNKVGGGTSSAIGGRFVKRFAEIYSGDQSMVKSMELDMGDQPIINDIKEIKEDLHQPENYGNRSPLTNCSSGMEEEEGEANMFRFPDRVCLSTVLEEDEEGEDHESTKEDEVEKEIVEENIGHVRRAYDFEPIVDSESDEKILYFQNGDLNDSDCHKDGLAKQAGLGHGLLENMKDVASARKTRIQNIFRLCGNHRELAQQVRTPFSSKKKSEESTNTLSSPLAPGKVGADDDFELQAQSEVRQQFIPDLKVNGSPISSLLVPLASLHLSDEQKAESRCISSEKLQNNKENSRLGDVEGDGLMEVYVKWEASKELSGNILKKFKVAKNSALSDLRKLVETHLEEENNKLAFTFLLLGDPSGAPVTKEKETTTQVSKLPIWNNELHCHLACLRPIKKVMQRPNPIPFSSLENTLAAGLRSPHSEGLSPKIRSAEHRLSYRSEGVV